MDQQHCVICGKELGLFSASCIRCGQTNQPVCTVCEKLIQGADDHKRLSLLEVMEKSPHLVEPEKFREYLEQEREMLARRGRNYTCCGQPMSYRGELEFQLGSTDFLTGSLGNLLSGSLELSVFVCEHCGRYKFYDPARVPGTRAYQIAAESRENHGGEESAPPEPEQPQKEKEQSGFFGRKKKDKPGWEL